MNRMANRNFDIEKVLSAVFRLALQSLVDFLRLQLYFSWNQISNRFLGSNLWLDSQQTFGSLH